MSDRPVMTHAAALVSFRQELLEGGYSPEEVAHLAAIALAEMVNGEGLCVRDIKEVSA